MGDKKSKRQLLIRWGILLVLFALSLVAISFYGGTISYSIFFGVLLLPVTCLIYILLELWRFRIYQDIGSRTVVSGQPVSYFFTLQNEDKLAFSSVRVRFFSDFSAIETLPENPEYELLPGDRYTYETRVICHYRGEYEVGVKDVILTDFIGLFHIRYRFPGTIRAEVLPKVVDIPEIRALKEIKESSENDLQDPLGVPDAVLRDYAPGDPVKLIAWRETARLQKPVVRQLIREERQGACVILDCFREDKEARISYIPAENKLLEIMIALGLYCAERQVPCTLLRNGEGGASVIRSLAEFRRFYEDSSQISFGRAVPMEDFLLSDGAVRTLNDAGFVFFAVRTLTKRLYTEAKELTADGRFVVIYVVSDEKLPDFADASEQRFAVVQVGPDDDLTEVL